MFGEWVINWLIAFYYTIIDKSKEYKRVEKQVGLMCADNIPKTKTEIKLAQIKYCFWRQLMSLSHIIIYELLYYVNFNHCTIHCTHYKIYVFVCCGLERQRSKQSLEKERKWDFVINELRIEFTLRTCVCFIELVK